MTPQRHFQNIAKCKRIKVNEKGTVLNDHISHKLAFFYLFPCPVYNLKKLQGVKLLTNV